VQLDLGDHLTFTSLYSFIPNNLKSSQFLGTGYESDPLCYNYTLVFKTLEYQYYIGSMKLITPSFDFFEPFSECVGKFFTTYFAELDTGASLPTFMFLDTLNLRLEVESQTEAHADKYDI